MLLPFFEWMQGSSLSAVFLESVWLTPIIQCVHLVALTIFAGAVLVVDVRLLGRGLTNTPLAQVAQDAQPWLIWGFVVLLVTGLPQLTSTAIKQYYSPFFWYKMELLLLGLIFTFTIRRKITLADEARLGPYWPKVAGFFSIAIWTSVTVWARLIGLLS